MPIPVISSFACLISASPLRHGQGQSKSFIAARPRASSQHPGHPPPSLCTRASLDLHTQAPPTRPRQSSLLVLTPPPPVFYSSFPLERVATTSRRSALLSSMLVVLCSSSPPERLATTCLRSPTPPRHRSPALATPIVATQTPLSLYPSSNASNGGAGAVVGGNP
jgi:hypothetical protein